MAKNSSASSAKVPQVKKQAELELMVELITNGLWSNVNLATALHVDRDTIAEWKKRPEVQDAHRQAVLKYSRRRTDVESILKELDIETQTQPQSLTQINNYISLPDEQLDAIIAAKVRQIGPADSPSGEGKTQESQPA